MGQGLGAVLPIVVVGVVADLLVQLLLHVEIVLLAGIARGFGGLLSRHRPWVSLGILTQPIGGHQPNGPMAESGPT